jgi:hypothetical protein
VAECFCGCGRKVKFSRRAPNTSGGRVSEALGKLEAIRADPELRALLDDDFGDFIAEGEGWCEGLAAITLSGERGPHVRVAIEQFVAGIKDGISITFDRYGHLMPGAEHEARGLLDAYLERVAA